MPLRNPIEWSLAEARLAMASIGSNTVTGQSAVEPLPAVARITSADLRDELARGWDVFAAAALAIGVIAFPMLIDRPVGVEVSIPTSLRATAANPMTILWWGLVVAFPLALAAIPFFVGLVVVLPPLGHATWHLYGKLVPG